MIIADLQESKFLVVSNIMGGLSTSRTPMLFV
jgi:hypothetical protein